MEKTEAKKINQDDGQKDSQTDFKAIKGLMYPTIVDKDPKQGPITNDESNTMLRHHQDTHPTTAQAVISIADGCSNNQAEQCPTSLRRISASKQDNKKENNEERVSTNKR